MKGYLIGFGIWQESQRWIWLVLLEEMILSLGEMFMAKNAKLVRWLAPCCLFILLLILILAVVFTSSPSTPSVNAVATVVNQVNQTATAQGRPGLTATAEAKATANSAKATATASAKATETANANATATAGAKHGGAGGQ